MDEIGSVRTVVSCGASYGYGNMILRLKIAWMLDLHGSGLGWEGAMLGALLSKVERRRFLTWAKTDEAGFVTEMNSLIGKA